MNQVNVTPVLALSTVAINLGGRIRDAVPERTTGQVLVPRVALSIEYGLAGVQGVVVNSLERPFANKNREFGLLGDILGFATYSGVNVASVGAGSGEVVDVRVEDNILGCP